MICSRQLRKKLGLNYIATGLFCKIFFREKFSLQEFRKVALVITFRSVYQWPSIPFPTYICTDIIFFFIDSRQQRWQLRCFFLSIKTWNAPSKWTCFSCRTIFLKKWGKSVHMCACVEWLYASCWTTIILNNRGIGINKLLLKRIVSV